MPRITEHRARPCPECHGEGARIVNVEHPDTHELWATWDDCPECEGNGIVCVFCGEHCWPNNTCHRSN